MSFARFTYALVALIALVYILTVTKSYLLPFIIALLIWYLIRETREGLRRVPFIRDRFPHWLQNVLVFGLMFLIISLGARLLASNIQQFSRVLPTYEKNVELMNAYFLNTFNVNLIESLTEYANQANFTDAIQAVLRGLSSLLGDGFMILLYCVFIILEESIFMKKFRLLFDDEEQFEGVAEMMKKIDKSFSNYIGLKTLVSVITAVLSFIVLQIIGVDAPVLWAFIIFLLNYIPSIGSLIATTFPAVIAMLQNSDIIPGVWVLLGVGAIQIVMGNIVEPRIMGNSLNISPLIVILSLVVWGAIWGILGMVLSVPITVIIVIIMAQFPSTKSIAILLSENGYVDGLQIEEPREGIQEEEVSTAE